MRFCKSCLSDFEQGTTQCPDCGAPLVSREEFDRVLAERDEILTEPYERVCTLEDRFEGPLLEQVLIAQDIRCLLRPFQDAAYDGLFIPQQGWGALFVPERDAARATEIIEATRAEVEAREDDEDTEGD